MFGRTKSSLTKEDILSKVRYEDLVAYYFGVSELPCLINSPLRKDENPSFAFFMYNNIVFYKDFATGDSGDVFKALSNIWGYNKEDTIKKIYSDIKNNNIINTVLKAKTSKTKSVIRHVGRSKLDVAVRQWKQYDLDYWGQFNISQKWLDYAEVYPISHVFITNIKGTFRFPADKYAYAYIERKEGRISKKVYQPFNKDGFKWCTDHDKSVISLWTKIPSSGHKICICSSTKDALSLWCNTGIPAIAIQGEGFPMSNHAISDLKARFKDIYIILDNDPPGLRNALKLAEMTGFKNVVLPNYLGGKDIAEIVHKIGDKDEIKKIFDTLL